MDCCAICFELDSLPEEVMPLSKAALSIGISDVDMLDIRDEEVLTDLPPNEEDPSCCSPLSTPRASPSHRPQADKTWLSKEDSSPPVASTVRAASLSNHPSLPKSPLSNAPASPARQNPLVGKHLCDMSPEEKEAEKRNLQSIVRQFAEEATRGIALKVVDIADGTLYPIEFFMDRKLAAIKLQSTQTPSKTAVPTSTIPMIDVQQVYRSGDVLQKHGDFPLGAEEISEVVGMTFLTPRAKKASGDIFFLFSGRSEMDRFYVSLKILRLSASIALKRQQERESTSYRHM